MVAESIQGITWNLPCPRSQQALDLHIHLTTIKFPLRLQQEDSFGWFVNGTDCNGYSSSKTWEAIRHKDTEKSWVPSIWFKGATPRNAFLMWISHLDRLPTRSRLLSWGLQVSPLCCLCSLFTESRDHLLLSCSFSRTIWQLVQSRLRMNNMLFQDWEGLTSWTTRNSIIAPSILRKLVAQATTYAIWKQRNNFIHNSFSIPPATIFKAIDREIINSINAKRHRRKFRNLMSLWIN